MITKKYVCILAGATLLAACTQETQYLSRTKPTPTLLNVIPATTLRCIFHTQTSICITTPAQINIIIGLDTNTLMTLKFRIWMPCSGSGAPADENNHFTALG